jgi:Domain of unknown function (DUF4351)
MSQFPHDEFAKNLFELLLTPFGGVEIERGVQPEAKAVDIYFQPSKPIHLQTGIIVIHQLPRTPETVWFRLMGRGTVQENAISEVAELPVNSPYKGNALDLFLSLKIGLESKQSIEPEERDLAMRLSALYIEKIQEAQQVGEARGRQEGELDLVRVLLKEIVGDVPPELNDRIALLSLAKLPELAKALLRFNSIDDLALWLTNNQ